MDDNFWDEYAEEKRVEGVYSDHCYNCDKPKRTLSNGLCVHCNSVLQTEDYTTDECKMCGRERSLNEQGYCSSCWTIWNS